MICERCSKEYEVDNKALNHVCRDCARIIGIRCQCCGNYRANTKRYAQLGTVCSSCITTFPVCKHCNQRHDKTDTEKVCQQCLVKVYGRKRCPNCGVVHQDVLDKFQRNSVCAEYDVTYADTICLRCYQIKLDDSRIPKSGYCFFCNDNTTVGIICDDGKCRCQKHYNYQVCVDCGVHTSRVGHSTGGTICGKCMEKQVRCNLCGTFEKQSQLKQFDQNGHIRHVCTPCFETYEVCQICTEIHPKGKFGMHRNRRMCYKCIKNYPTCAMCDSDVGPFHKKYNEDNGKYCRVCIKKHGIPVYERYDYRPDKFNIIGEPPHDVLYGIEHEISVAEDFEHCLAYFSKLFHKDHVYTMHDGTIDRGFEVVVHPMTYPELMNNTNGFIDKLFPAFIRKSTSCGNHIHISRTAFLNEDHLYYFMKFFVDKKSFIEFIAGRKGGGARQFQFTPANILKDKCKGVDVQDKYVDINIKHKASIEVRVFAGVTTKEQLYKNIQFLDCLIKLTRDHVPTIPELLSYAEYNGYSYFSNYATKFIEPKEDEKEVKQKPATNWRHVTIDELMRQDNF